MNYTVQFIPIKHGDSISIGDTGYIGIGGTNKILGFKPGRTTKRAGWLVVAISDGGKRDWRPRKHLKKGGAK